MKIDDMRKEGGVRTKKNHKKTSTPEQPLISIVTIVYNGDSVLEKTIKSIVGQTYNNIEYIIIDGGSTDNTLRIIHEYDDSIDYWISEKDNGIYDAMNKGLKTTAGDYVWFINAGDEIYAHDTIEKFSYLFSEDADVYYGEAMYVDVDGRERGLRSRVTPHKLPDSLKWQHMNRGLVVCHQSFIIRRTIAPYYDLKFPHSGDIDWIIRCLKISQKVINTNIILSRYLINGHSKQFHFRSLIDRYRVLQKHFGVIPNFFNHILILLRAIKRGIFIV